ncbi:Chagasin family peptidase inhibitor I42 [Acinetobacter bouvetii]|uniref:Chagasin family peptidase inhibitor I42 n=2 Tax=Acinetobacter bouvetii TaxID=202951 RepID=A0A811GJ54_9GAMM|nr:Chagasin family peptidase inhibitor I42 [Acinetobacter bouvetii]
MLAACFTAILGLSMAGCSSMSPTVDGKTHVYSLKQKCPTLLDMKVGQTLELTLPENPSTGYIWQVAQPQNILKVEEIYQQDQVKSQQPMVGVGGQKLFRFTALQPGEEWVHVKHGRAWEQNAIDEWSCRVRVS